MGSSPSEKTCLYQLIKNNASLLVKIIAYQSEMRTIENPCSSKKETLYSNQPFVTIKRREEEEEEDAPLKSHLQKAAPPRPWRQQE